MVRTVLRSRSDGVVSAVQLADRTGIVAASAPPLVEPEEAGESLPPVVFAMPEPPAKTRRVRRNLLFACAAALFLLVGWIGGTLGHHDPAPAVASAPVADQVPADGPRGGPATTSEPAAPPAAPPAPVPVPVPKRVTATKRVTVPKQAAAPENEPVQPRSGPVESSSLTEDPVSTVSEQVMDLWAWANGQGRNGNGWAPRGNGR